MKNYYYRYPLVFIISLVIFLFTLFLFTTFPLGQGSEGISGPRTKIVQYSNYFDVMRNEGKDYYFGSQESIKLQNLLLDQDYTVRIEGNLTIPFTATASNMEIKFIYNQQFTNHLTIELLDSTDAVIDTYEMPIIELTDQFQLPALDDILVTFGGYIVLAGFLLAFIIAVLKN